MFFEKVRPIGFDGRFGNRFQYRRYIRLELVTIPINTTAIGLHADGSLGFNLKLKIKESHFTCDIIYFRKYSDVHSTREGVTMGAKVVDGGSRPRSDRKQLGAVLDLRGVATAVSHTLSCDEVV